MSAPVKAKEKEKCQKPGLVLTRGTKVEARSDNEGFQGAWFGATILEPPITPRSKNKGKVLVEYESLLADDGVNLCVEYISPTYIRPLPPKPDNVKLFELYEVVDAYYHDGWWKGVVTNVQEAKQDKKYTVVFENPPDQIEFWPRDLRFTGTR